MNKVYIFLLFAGLVFFACKHDALVTNLDQDMTSMISSRSQTGNLEYFIFPDETDFANIPQVPSNPITQEKVTLGRMLFYESCFGVEAKRTSGMATFSCSSCHLPTAGFRPNRNQGIADGGQGFGINGEGRTKRLDYNENEIDAQGVRPLSMLNVAYVVNSLWSGAFGHEGVNVGTEDIWGEVLDISEINHERFGSLEGQNIEGLELHRLLVNRELVEFYGYDKYFDAAFPDVPEEERYTRKTASFAISAYLRTLLCTEAPFQRWLKGDYDAMLDEQKRGALLFFGKAGCYRCHYEPNLGSMEFHALAVDDLFENGGLNTSVDDRRNLGRAFFTGRSEDEYKFRVPQLYNMGDGGPYFHGASKSNLTDLIHYFNNGIPENSRVPSSQVSDFFHPLNLSDTELQDLEAFIRDGLRDPHLQRYVPEQVLSGFCFPNNDPVSQEDLGCN
ncbi:MAG: cytochrome c peroxidase [Saprospiraceae bacterium]